MSMETILSVVRLDVYDHDTTPTTIKTIALDSQTRYVHAYLQRNGLTYQPDPNAVVTLTAIRPDKVGAESIGQVVMLDEATDDGPAIYGLEAEITQAMIAVPGIVLFQFKMEVDNEVLRTEIFRSNNGRALDGEASSWADKYQGYNLDELAEKVEFAVRALDDETQGDASQALLSTHLYIDRKISVHDNTIHINDPNYEPFAGEKWVEPYFANMIGKKTAEWLDDHPEATTTVPDGSLTDSKFSGTLKLKAIKDYVTPQMFGAVGNGIADDTEAFQNALDDDNILFVPKGTYKITESLTITKRKMIVGTGRRTSIVQYTGTDALFDMPTTAAFFEDIAFKGDDTNICFCFGDNTVGNIKYCTYGTMKNVFLTNFDTGLLIRGAWGWEFFNLSASRISSWLIHCVGTWNTCNFYGGNYELQAVGGVFWEGAKSNVINFKGVIWESLTGDVFKVDSSANVSCNIIGCYFENPASYIESGTARNAPMLVNSASANSEFNFIGYNVCAYYQTIKSAGIVNNPPKKCCKILTAFAQPYYPNEFGYGASFIDNADYGSHDYSINLKGKTLTNISGFDAIMATNYNDLFLRMYKKSYASYWKNSWSNATDYVQEVHLFIKYADYKPNNFKLIYEWDITPNDFSWDTFVGFNIGIYGSQATSVVKSNNDTFNSTYKKCNMYDAINNKARPVLQTEFHITDLVTDESNLFVIDNVKYLIIVCGLTSGQAAILNRIFIDSY